MRETPPHLTRVFKLARNQHRHGRVQISVVQNDIRVLAAEFEIQFDQRARGRLCAQLLGTLSDNRSVHDTVSMNQKIYTFVE
jgi:hypothetical protein